MSVRNLRWKNPALQVLIALLGLLAGIASCGKEDVNISGSFGRNKIDESKPITALSISPPGVTMNRGESRNFTATATYDDGSTGDVTSSITWSVAKVTGMASINQGGLLTGLVAGDATLTATDNASGVSDSVNISMASINLWTWMGGTDTLNPASVNGTKGTPDPTVRPSGMQNFDAGYNAGTDTAWILGGDGKTGTNTPAWLDNLFKWDGTNWTWVSGTDLDKQAGVYGSKGVTTATNQINSRMSGGTLMFDKNGIMWKFGGSGVAPGGTVAPFSDLWKWDGTNWTWVAGPQLAAQSGVYGSKGVAHPANYPGGRYRPGTAFDSKGNLWVFGGNSYDSLGTLSPMNDLWKFDGTNWTWISGPNTGNGFATFGTMGVSSPANVPGARLNGFMVIDSQDNLIVYSGNGFVESGPSGNLRDMWKFNTTTLEWTWIHGPNTTVTTAGNYGTKGLAAPTNYPPYVFGTPFLIDAADNIWLFGGSSSQYNHLWKFDGTNWTWISGDQTTGQVGVYGTLGTPGALNKPGGRNYSNGWVDNKGDFYFYGGYGFNHTTLGDLGDLWRFQP